MFFFVCETCNPDSSITKGVQPARGCDVPWHTDIMLTITRSSFIDAFSVGIKQFTQLWEAWYRSTMSVIMANTCHVDNKIWNVAQFIQTRTCRLLWINILYHTKTDMTANSYIVVSMITNNLLQLPHSIDNTVTGDNRDYNRDLSKMQIWRRTRDWQQWNLPFMRVSCEFFIK